MYVMSGSYTAILLITILDVEGIIGVGEFSSSIHGCTMLTML